MSLRDRLISENGALKAELASLQAKYDKLKETKGKSRKKSTVRRRGEHWYRLEYLFAPGAETPFVVDGGPEGAHLLGVLDDFVVVTVPKDTEKSAAAAFQAFLRERGMTSVVFVTTPDVQFMKLVAVSDFAERELDEKLQALREGKIDGVEL